MSVSPTDLLELMALTSAAVPGAADVLHDVLLERYGRAYADVLRGAIGDADAFQQVFDVRVNRTAGAPNALFYVRLTDSPNPYREPVSFVARPRWRPRALVYFDGARRAFDPRTDATVAIREQGGWLVPTPDEAPGVGGPWIADPDLLDLLDEALVRRVRTELARRWTPEALVRWLRWNDPNGDYRGIRAVDARRLILEAVEEEHLTPDEMRRAARR